ncbi:hypothetical protein [Dyella tabacisoli]|uniref:Uncharacterized protein n=1 Tax=Dyella tabacisoli TaxID=2282381 RepID=A0A369UYX9_9GAMM|nr:hypothetical protein [Dyella tabacisoli]RDD83539.1 hypothetical protein DVJ77_02895 [Dyella tabacisoli]
MSSIGIIVRADANAGSLSQDWMPAPLGQRQVVESIVAELMSGTEHLMLTANIEGPEESADPRAITVSGVWGDEERAVLRQLCNRLSARFYVAETGEFEEL